MQGLICIDVGGTGIRGAAVYQTGQIGDVCRRLTKRERPASAILEDICGVIGDVQADMNEQGYRCRGISVGVPTTMDSCGRLRPCDNIPSFTGLRLERLLEGACPLPVKVFNDAMCFAVGEWRCGIGTRCRNFCCVPIGTGIGLGLVLNGVPYCGSHGAAGEIWKAPLSGRVFEEIVSGQAVSRAYAGPSGRAIEAIEVAKHAESGDECAVLLFERFGDALGKGLAWIANIFDPEVIALAGSVAGSKHLFEKAMFDSFRRYAVMASTCTIAVSMLGEAASLAGAAFLFDREHADAVGGEDMVTHELS